MGAPPHDLDALRARLAGGEGPVLWRSLEAVADTAAFRHFVEAEFPASARLAAGPDRRQMLRLMAASFAMAGLAGCEGGDNGNVEVPYVRNPERIEVGEGLSYASAALLDGVANGVLVTTRNGRPLKIEGNPDHPWSRGGTDAFAQASILDLYDPARSQTVRYLNRISTWSAFGAAMVGQFGALRAAEGAGLRLLTGPVTSPTLLGQIDRMRQAFPQMVWHVLAPVGREAAYAATQRVFGRRLETRLDFAKARVVVSIGSDMLDPGPHQVGVSRHWSEARRAQAAAGSLLTLHAAASTPTLTSAKADYHLAVEPGDMEALVAALRSEVAGPTEAATTPRSVWLKRAGEALRQARGAGLVLAGADQPPAVQDAVHRLNAELGHLGQTVTFTEPLFAEAQSIEALAEAMRGGQVSTLLMLDTNPVYAAGAAAGFTDALGRVALKIHVGSYVDETAAHADWHAPLAHPLESWGDARSLDGTVTLHQPTIAPLYNGRSSLEILSMIVDPEPSDGLTLVRERWSGEQDPGTADLVWRGNITNGFIAGTAFPTVTVQPQAEGAARTTPPAAAGLAVLFRPDPTVWDGRHADNAWLQECPKPLTKITWGNPVAVSPALAQREGLAQGDLVTVTLGGRAVEGPVWILPGQAPDTLTLYFGYGRGVPDALSNGFGYDAFALRPPGGVSQAFGATIAKTGRAARFATTQDHASLDGHDFVRVQSVGAPAFAGRDTPLPSIYPNKGPEDRAWAMVIDGDACIGCNACVIACQSENNIPVVGADEVRAGREMHWLRIDRYYSDLKGGAGLDEPDTHFQPVPCMHCEDAPCEVGCPVEATLHDHEGLNLMVYNRCVGTRACSGYCPYKVRHFNYGDYNDISPPLQQQRNPEVSVRGKGVMEKCTYCVQRIANARIVSDKTNLPIADGTVETACQGACPTRAITFGDLNDKGSAVTAGRRDPRNYALLGELNLRPRTTYLAERLPPETGTIGKG